LQWNECHKNCNYQPTEVTYIKKILNWFRTVKEISIYNNSKVPIMPVLNP